MPALPEINRPGSIRMRSPRGLSSGASVARTGRRQDFFCARRPPPAGGTALQRRVINDAQAAADAEELQPCFSSIVSPAAAPSATASSKGRTEVSLRADVHLANRGGGCFSIRCARVQGLDVFNGNPELVLISARRDFCVRAGVHIRVYAHGDRRNFFPARGDAVDARSSASLSTLKE